jgi:hypothetical protein
MAGYLRISQTAARPIDEARDRSGRPTGAIAAWRRAPLIRDSRSNVSTEEQVSARGSCPALRFATSETGPVVDRFMVVMIGLEFRFLANSGTRTRCCGIDRDFRNFRKQVSRRFAART